MFLVPIDNILLFEEQVLEVLTNDIIDDMFVANKYKGDDMFEETRLMLPVTIWTMCLLKEYRV